MDTRTRLLAGVGVLAAITLITTAATASDRDSGNRSDVREQLSGYEEDPLTVSTAGTGEFRAKINRSEQTIEYTLSYADLGSTVQQAHIHFGGRAQSGGISVFLCTNLNNGPAGTQLCPAAPATISGTITPADVIGPANQGITAGEFAELLAAVRAETTYVNVHSVNFPGGEIRGQIEDGEG
jgi:hypothetical protein